MSTEPLTPEEAAARAIANWSPSLARDADELATIVLDAARAAQDVAGREGIEMPAPSGYWESPEHWVNTQPATPPPDALREALEREHYQNLKAHAPDFPHSHPGTFSERCGICAAKSECLSCAALRAQGVVQSPDPEAIERERHARWVHDEEHGEDEMCGGDCIEYGLVTFPVDESRDPDVREPGEGDTTR